MDCCEYVASSHVCDGFEEGWGACPSLPDCGPCEPRDCVWSEWSDWDNGGQACVGLKFRSRRILLDANECGAHCSGATMESERLITEECRPHGDDCKYSEWNEWETEAQPYCNDKRDQATRTRYVEQPPGLGGRACDEALKETKPCGGPEPQDCVFSSWQPWTSCSASCGEGRHTRMRHIATAAKNNGQPCEDMVLETHACVIEACPGTDCVLSAWAEWSQCDDEHNQRYRTRSIEQETTGGGRPCGSDLMQTLGCPRVLPTDCELSQWGEWSECDPPCGGGQRTREREMTKAPHLGGRCPPYALQQTQGCQSETCDTGAKADCSLSEWGEWSECPVSCGQGSVRRSRSVSSLAQSGGIGCSGPLSEASMCLLQTCEVSDCVWGEWEQWSGCSATCGGGTMQRTRTIAVSPRGGAVCAAKTKAEAIPCSTQACADGCVDGFWGEWLHWSSCTASCDLSYKSRRREIGQFPNHCGRPPTGVKEEFVKCENMPSCVQDRDCELSEWNHWSECSCSCFGIRERNRAIGVFPSGDGRSCNGDALKEVQPCNPGGNGGTPEGCAAGGSRKDCVMGEWQGWSRCSVTCGGGQMAKRRHIVQQATEGGRPCDSEVIVTAPCGMQKCEHDHTEPQDCLWGAWSEWGDCTRCGGQKYRSRHIDRMNNALGRPCELKDSKEMTHCVSQCEDDLFCAWSEWSKPECTAQCGSSTSIRSRAMGFHKAPPERGYFFVGQDFTKCSGSQLDETLCPAQAECSDCVPRDCEFSTWGDWSELKCQGLCERQRSILTMNNECGTPCSGILRQTRHCEATCEEVKDCVLSQWTEWSGCSGDGGEGQKYRRREILQKPTHGGMPCLGMLDMTVGCAFDESSLPEPCTFEAWADWSACSVSCGDGWHTRSRKVQLGRSLGAQCRGDTKELQPCTEWSGDQCGDSSEVNCVMSRWGPWSACDVSGQRYRHRSIVSPVRDGGQPCAGVMHETKQCEKSAVDCQYSDWTEWGQCDKTCGTEGQATRQRQISVFPEKGGRPCPKELMETIGCSLEECEVQDAELSAWTDWCHCSATCGPGMQSRVRAIAGLREAGGYGADGALGQARQCADNPPCVVNDCAWEDWRDWSPCTATCGGGNHHRHRHIATAPDPSGSTCEARSLEEVASCNTQSCDSGCIHGEWSDWGPWSWCSASCGGGTTFRTRNVAVAANACGSPPFGKDKEVGFCNTEESCSPDQDCKLSGWQEWSACSATCSGVQRRSRMVEQYGSGNGQKCSGALQETWPCNPAQHEDMPPGCAAGPPQDCRQSDWTQWSICSTTCGGGQEMREREILQRPTGGGLACERSIIEVNECGRGQCDGSTPVDCAIGDWEDWGECGHACGVRYRHRKIARYASHGGLDCQPADLGEAERCPSGRCAEERLCTWQAWGDWGQCTATCGTGGKRRHKRYLKLGSARSHPPKADPPEMKDEVEHGGRIQRRIEDLEARHANELAVAFAAGCGCLLVMMSGFRLAVTLGRGADRPDGYLGLDRVPADSAGLSSPRARTMAMASPAAEA